MICILRRVVIGCYEKSYCFSVTALLFRYLESLVPRPVRSASPGLAASIPVGLDEVAGCCGATPGATGHPLFKGLCRAPCERGVEEGLVCGESGVSEEKGEGRKATHQSEP